MIVCEVAPPLEQEFSVLRIGGNLSIRTSTFSRFCLCACVCIVQTEKLTMTKTNETNVESISLADNGKLHEQQQMTATSTTAMAPIFFVFCSRLNSKLHRQRQIVSSIELNDQLHAPSKPGGLKNDNGFFFIVGKNAIDDNKNDSKKAVQ